MRSSVSHSANSTAADAMLCPQIDLLDSSTRAAFDNPDALQRLVPAGSVVLAEGDTRAPMEVIRDGWAASYKSLGNGRRQIVSFLLPGDLIGIQSEITGTESTTVEAITDVHLQAGDSLAPTDTALLAKPAELNALAIVQKRQVEEMMVSVGQRDAVERTAALLLGLFDRASARGMVRAGTLMMPLTQKHLSAALGLSIIHANRVLGALTRAAIVRLGRRRLQVLDRDRLVRAARSPAHPVKGQETTATSSTAAKRVLIVEDEFHTAQWIDEILRRMGIEVVGPVGTLRAAMLLAKTQPIDAALLDVRLHHSERVYPVADLLRYRQIPFSFITAYADHSFERFPDDLVIRKPFREVDLQALVRNLVGAGSRAAANGGIP